MHNKYFTEEEAERKLGKLVISLIEFSGISVGTVGEVVRKYGDKKTWGLDIKWLFIHTKRNSITDGFSKDEYEEFLEELK